MDANRFIDDLIASARHLSIRALELTEAKLGVPRQGPQREAMLDGMGKGALAAGTLSLLLGTVLGRQIIGLALKLGGLAAVGAIACKACKDWQRQPTDTIDDSDIPADRLTERQAARGELLLQAMVVAAMADGHIDNEERSRIEDQLADWGLERDLERCIDTQLRRPAGLADLAARADSIEAAAEIYLVSRLVIDPDDPAEERYLDDLVAAIGLDPTLREELDRQAAAAG